MARRPTWRERLEVAFAAGVRSRAGLIREAHLTTDQVELAERERLLVRDDSEDDWSDDEDAPYDWSARPPEPWGTYIQHHTPRGYDVFHPGRPQDAPLSTKVGWEWARAGEGVQRDVPRDLTKVEARAAAWRDLLWRLPPATAWRAVGFLLADTSIFPQLPFPLREALLLAARREQQIHSDQEIDR